MNRTQKYISLLLERLPKYELRSYEHQTILDRIRDRVSSTPDIYAELRSLYQVKGCADFALSLMWIADKVEKDITKEESTIDEETHVFSKFRQAIGDESPSGPESGTAGTMFNLSGSQEAGSMPTPELNSDFNLSSPPGFESISTPEATIDSIFGATVHSPELNRSAGGGSKTDSEQEQRFSLLLEKFLESVQSGNDDRTKLLSDIIDECNTVITAGSAAEDYKQFCKMLIEFLEYISNNQYLDDVRVMNILSNIQDPFAQWARSMPDKRAGIMSTVNDTLRDFRTMFE
ncbi:MAG: hypothetical protein NTX44_02690 [Ignavibacteriales bacterium]|nr:hypothetical protein [Ignavibacteriales bacterium]